MPEIPPKQHAAMQNFCAQTKTNAARKPVPQEDAPPNIEAGKLLSFWAAKKGVSAPELEYRARILRDIAVRRDKDGPHAARAHADRARQFMPFAALKGYHELAHEQEFVRQPRQDMTDERARVLSETVAALRKGDRARAVHYENGAYATACGVIASVDLAFRSLAIGKKRISFDDILSLERLQ